MSDADPVRKFLDLSTAHLPQEICTNLGSIDGVTAYEMEEYGWFVYVPQDGLSDQIESMPAELRRVVLYAIRNDCDYIFFDRDAKCLDDLPTWEW